MRGIACQGLKLVTGEVGRKGKCSVIGAKVRNIFQEGENDQLFFKYWAW